LTEGDESAIEVVSETESEESEEAELSGEDVYEGDLGGELNKKGAKGANGGSKYKVVIDTNVFEIKFKCLMDKEINLFKNGNHWRCGAPECSGFFNKHSKLAQNGNSL